MRRNERCERVVMQILNTDFPQNMLTGGLVSGQASFAGLRHAQNLSPAEVIQLISTSGLRGRSGVSRPAADKWQLCAAQTSDDKLIVMNTIDGDPLLPAAATLLAVNPAGAIEGMLIAAHAAGARQAIICLDGQNSEQKSSLESLLRDLVSTGVTGSVIIWPGRHPGQICHPRRHRSDRCPGRQTGHVRPGAADACS
jgi:NADH:ubiquinone oxidoreductase subunit F (NADH-binding)